MTFEVLEAAKLSQPVEFLTIKNGTSLWYYTNSSIIEVIGSRTFTPLAYTRTEPVFSKDSSDGQIKFTIPSNLPIIEFYETLPSSFISSVTIERRHRNDPDGGVQIFWKGTVASVKRDGKFATILAVPPTQLSAEVPRYTYSALCNWFLFQDRCELTREQWRHIGTVTTIGTAPQNNIITVDGLRAQAAILAGNVSPSYGTAQQIDDYWLGGYVQTDSGEKRAVYGTDVDGNPDKIRVLQPFRNLEVNDTVQVYAGCDRTRATCAAKFNNQLRHGGFPEIPILNPFTAELPNAAASATTKKRFWGN